MPLLALRRPPWAPQAGDRWIEVASMEEAVDALGQRPRRVFLTVGRLELPPFAAAPQHTYLVRTIEPIGDALPVPNVIAIQDRAPFDEAAERALMERERIEVVVTKNSGGHATYPKIAAARALGPAGHHGRAAGEAGRRRGGRDRRRGLRMARAHITARTP